MSSTGTATLSGVYRENGPERTQLRLGSSLGSGGEGKIFEVASRTSHVVKLYHKPSDYKRLKLEAMLKAIPDDPQKIKRNHISICWPEEIVFSRDKSMAGFLMPRLDTSAYQKVAICWDPHDRAQCFPGFSWRYLCVAAANIASVVEMLHKKWHIVGDLNDENFMVNDRALVTLIDCDSMQVRDPGTSEIFRCQVARPEYLAPEAFSKDLTAIDRTFQHDYWALAVLVFRMLMEGYHPTSGIGPIDELEKKVKAGIFPFLGAARWTPPKQAPPVSMLPDGLRRLFERCFHDGHRRPELRPTAADWRKELQCVGASLIQCPRERLHWYAPHVSQCPWCREKKRGNDFFPGNAADQIELESAAARTVKGPIESPQDSETWYHHTTDRFGLSFPSNWDVDLTKKLEGSDFSEIAIGAIRTNDGGVIGCKTLVRIVSDIFDFWMPYKARINHRVTHDTSRAGLISAGGRFIEERSWEALWGQARSALFYFQSQDSGELAYYLVSIYRTGWTFEIIFVVAPYETYSQMTSMIEQILESLTFS